MLAGAVENCSLGGLREIFGRSQGSENRSWRAPGALWRWPRASKIAVRGEKVLKSAQEASWSHLGAENGKTREVELSHLEALGGAFWEAVGGLGGIFLLLLLSFKFLDDYQLDYVYERFFFYVGFLLNILPRISFILDD